MNKNGIPCTLLVNNRWGYEFAPREFDSIKAAVECGKAFLGGFYWKVIGKDRKVLRKGYCDK